MDKGACPEQFDKFCKLWPDGAEITLKNAMIAVDNGLNLSFVAMHFLSEENYYKYQIVAGKAWDKLRTRIDRNIEEYIASDGSEEAHNRFDKKGNRYLNDYEKSKGRALVKLFNQQENGGSS